MSNVDWNIEVFIKIAKNKETIENKEQTTIEANSRKEEILTNVTVNKLKISNQDLMNVNNSLRRRS